MPLDGIEEIKTLFADTQKVATAAQAKAEELAKKSADYIDNDTFKKMKDEHAEKMSEMDKLQADLKARLEEVETKANRPGAPGTAKVDTPESKAFADYMRKGIEPPAELKAMSTGSGTDGGYLVPDAVRDGIQARLRRSSPIRQVANVIAFDGGSYDVLVERGDTGYQWAGETEPPTDTSTPTIDRISISTHELSALPKVSQRMLDVATFDIEGWLQGRVDDRFARAEATAYISGNGVNRPKGILSYSSATTADESRAAQTLQYRATGASGDFAAAPNGANAIVQLFYDLQGAYMANASWMAKNTTMAAIAVLKDSDGAFLLRDMLNGDGTLVRTIMGRPAYVADDMPTIAGNSMSVAVGDFQAGYTIVDGQQIRVLRDPFSAKPNVLFYTTKRVGGAVTDFDAIKLLKFGMS